jgi:drug/metabolite transporter (DMT)-like permease
MAAQRPSRPEEAEREAESGHGGRTDWILLLGVSAAWGTLFLMVKKAMIYYTAWEVTGLRFALCLGLLSPFAARAVRSLTRKTAWSFVAVAIFGTAVPVLLLTLGQQRINSATTAIINALTPLSVFSVGRLVFGARLSRRQLAGVVTGFGGLMLLACARHGLELSTNPLFAVLALAAPISYGWTANYLRSRLSSVAAIDVTTLSYIMIGVPSVAVLVAWPGVLPKVAATPLMPSGVYLAGMSICSVLLVTGYYEMIRRRGALFAATVTYLAPLIAFGWAIVDGEPLGALHSAALAVILGGVGLANVSQTDVSARG